MDQFIPFISDVGFPIVVTLYLLHRIEAKLDTVVLSIQSLPDRMKEGTNRFHRLTKMDINAKLESAVLHRFRFMQKACSNVSNTFG